MVSTPMSSSYYTVSTTSGNTANLLEFEIPSGNTEIFWNLIVPPDNFSIIGR